MGLKRTKLQAVNAVTGITTVGVLTAYGGVNVIGVITATTFSGVPAGFTELDAALFN